MKNKVNDLKLFIEMNDSSIVSQYLSQNLDDVEEALIINPNLIEFIDFFTYDQQKKIIDERFENFKKIKNLHDDLQVLVISEFPRNIFMIRNPSEKAFLALFKKENIEKTINDYISLSLIVDHSLNYRKEFLTSKILWKFHEYSADDLIKIACEKHPNWKKPASLILEAIGHGHPDKTT